MSLRYYVCPLAETARPQGGTAWQPALPAGTEFATIIPSQPSGAPAFGWALVLVDALLHTVIELDPNVISLGLSPDSPMSDVKQNQRAQFTNKLRQHVPGFTINWSAETARDVADRLALWLEPAHTRGTLRVKGGF